MDIREARIELKEWISEQGLEIEYKSYDYISSYLSRVTGYSVEYFKGIIRSSGKSIIKDIRVRPFLKTYEDIERHSE